MHDQVYQIERSEITYKANHRTEKSDCSLASIRSLHMTQKLNASRTRGAILIGLTINVTGHARLRS